MKAATKIIGCIWWLCRVYLGPQEVATIESERLEHIMHASHSLNVCLKMHEMHGRIHPNYVHVTINFCLPMIPSSSGYLTVTHTHPIAGNLPIKTLVARRLQIIISYPLDVSTLTCFGDNCSNTPPKMVHNSIDITVSGVDVLCCYALTFTVYKELQYSILG